MTDIRLKRAYEPPANSDGTRILVDGLWPRGVSKDDLDLDDWLKDIAPSKCLRQWFDHDPDKWDGFCDRYAQELDNNPDAVTSLKTQIRKGRVTLVFAAKDEEHNNAVALKNWIETRL